MGGRALSAIEQRAEVARASAATSDSSEFRSWLRSHPTAVDADGDFVLLHFASDEPATVLTAEVTDFPHPVVVSTIHRGHVMNFIMGPAQHGPVEDSVPAARTVDVTDRLTVGDVAAALSDGGGNVDFVLVGVGQGSNLLVSA